MDNDYPAMVSALIDFGFSEPESSILAERLTPDAVRYYIARSSEKEMPLAYFRGLVKNNAEVPNKARAKAAAAKLSRFDDPDVAARRSGMRATLESVNAGLFDEAEDTFEVRLDVLKSVGFWSRSAEGEVLATFANEMADALSLPAILAILREASDQVRPLAHAYQELQWAAFYVLKKRNPPLKKSQPPVIEAAAVELTTVREIVLRELQSVKIALPAPAAPVPVYADPFEEIIT